MAAIKYKCKVGERGAHLNNFQKIYKFINLKKKIAQFFGYRINKEHSNHTSEQNKNKNCTNKQLNKYFCELVRTVQSYPSMGHV